MYILNKFLKYIQISTNSNSKTGKSPSTENQRNLAKILVQELLQLNMTDVWLDEEHCYVYAFLKGIENAPKIGFISHMDTSEAVTDMDIRPHVIKNYNGGNVHLNGNEMLDVNIYPDLKKHIGKTLITTDGNTLLGADDKAGIAEIMTMLEKIINKNIEHGDIYVAFTPDEEIGEGTKHFDFSKFKADFAYTVDGSDLGEICYENFNAATIKIHVKGISAHLGSAKNVMINSQLIANEIINLIPKEFPESTEGHEGFFHLASIQGKVADTEMKFLVRDFQKVGLEQRKQVLIKIVEQLNKKYNNCITVEVIESYHNMKEKITKNMHLIENAKKAMKNVDVVL